MKTKLVNLLKRLEKIELTGKNIYINSIKHSLKLIEKRKGGYENLIGSDKEYVDSTVKLAESYINGLEKIKEVEKIIEESNTIIDETQEANAETQEALNDLEEQTEEIDKIVNKKEEKKSFFSKFTEVIKNVITAPFRFAKKVFNFTFKRNKKTVIA